LFNSLKLIIISYDIGLYINTGNDEHKVKDLGNYTYNCSTMFRLALLVEYEGLNGLSGKLAKDVIPALEIAISRMENDPDKYKAMNPTNGWGDYESALEYIRGILNGCREHPATILRVY
jgi:hypothetical protein